MKVSRTLAAVAVAATAVTIPTVAAASPAHACEFPTYQYEVTGYDVTLFDSPGGNARATLRAGDLVNSNISPDQTGWLVGNAYTPAPDFIGSGYVLRAYTSYTGFSFC